MPPKKKKGPMSKTSASQQQRDSHGQISETPSTSLEFGEGRIDKITNVGLIKTDFDDTVTFNVDAIRPPTHNLREAFKIGQKVKFSAARTGNKWTAKIVCPIEMTAQFFYGSFNMGNEAFFGGHGASTANLPQPLSFMCHVDSAKIDHDISACRMYNQISTEIAKLAHSYSDNRTEDCPLCQQ